jgi:hypothetical protein
MLVFSGSARFDATYYGGNIDTTTAGRVDTWRFFHRVASPQKRSRSLQIPGHTGGDNISWFGLGHRSADRGQLAVVDSRIWSPVSGICTGMWCL